MATTPTDAGNGSSKPDAGSPGAGTWLPAAALALAMVSFGALTTVLIMAAVGFSPWPGFVAIALYGLPVSFLLLSALVYRSIRRRRRV